MSDVPPSSDHAPLCVMIALPSTAASPDDLQQRPQGPSRCPAYRWDRALEEDLVRYRTTTAQRLGAVQLPYDALRCDNPSCCNQRHLQNIDAFYRDVCDELRKCSDATIRRAGRDPARQHMVPGWNDMVADAHTDARNAYVLWRNCGKPHQGTEFEEMRATRRLFKIALRRCRAQEERLKEEALARSLSQRDFKGFWKQIAADNNARIPLPTSIDGHTGEAAIAEMWRSHFRDIMNSVSSDEHRHGVEERLRSISPADAVHFTPSDIRDSLAKVKKGKASGADGIAAEHFIFADPVVCVYLSLLFNCMLLHGHLPSSFMFSTIVPIVKNKTGDTTSKNNYRPVAIVSACSKILEACILRFTSHLLYSTDNQFGFKAAHSTDLCIFTLKSVVNYYLDFRSNVAACFLDASKAFDRVNHWTLFYKLLNRGIPIPIVRILCFWYRTQQVCIRWGSVLSSCFNVGNGVRQGSLLSPKLFTLYVDDLSHQLKSFPMGCFIDDVCTNHFFYADDICLLAPSASAMQSLLNVCSMYGAQHDIAFNAEKSLYLVFKPHRSSFNLPPVSLDGSELPTVHSAKYLGVHLEAKLNDDMDIERQYCRLYARCNTILRKFKHCSTDVKKQLFTSYCTNFYCMPLWSVFKAGTFRKAKVAYNNVFRSLFRFDRRTSASFMFVSNNVLNFEALFRKCIFDFRNRVFDSQNAILQVIRSNVFICTNSIFTRWHSTLHTIPF